MKKLFVSVPMKGRTEEAIKKSIEAMHKIAEIEFGEELELIDSYFDEFPSVEVQDKNKPVWYLGKSIQKLSEADFFIGVSRSNYKGCNIETGIAAAYSIPIIEIPIHQARFFEDLREIDNSCLANRQGKD